MAKKKEVIGEIKLQIPGGSATPAPPVGPALGAKGVNIGAFVKEFNDASGQRRGEVVPVVITVYKDKSFTFIMKEPPVPELIKKAIGKDKGASEPGPLTKHATITEAQVREIAERKAKELTAHSVETAMKTVLGTARSMGIVLEG
ncbi:MAG: 50S ribosomal protein L11 [Planctomycetota bacterium]|jgi:large subunit ribosomal protein L11|nr:50S ribosomal protein L11 [Planctomycetota bacterium]